MEVLITHAKNRVKLHVLSHKRGLVRLYSGLSRSFAYERVMPATESPAFQEWPRSITAIFVGREWFRLWHGDHYRAAVGNALPNCTPNRESLFATIGFIHGGFDHLVANDQRRITWKRLKDGIIHIGEKRFFGGEVLLDLVDNDTTPFQYLDDRADLGDKFFVQRRIALVESLAGVFFDYLDQLLRQEISGSLRKLAGQTYIWNSDQDFLQRTPFLAYPDGPVYSPAVYSRRIASIEQLNYVV